MAKWACGTYQTDGRGTSWLKIKNPEYSQTEGRHEFFTPGRLERGRVRGASARPELRLI